MSADPGGGALSRSTPLLSPRIQEPPRPGDAPTFLERERDARSPRGRVAFWWLAAVDVVRNGLGERLEMLRRTHGDAGTGEGLASEGVTKGGGGMDALAKDMSVKTIMPHVKSRTLP